MFLHRTHSLLFKKFDTKLSMNKIIIYGINQWYYRYDTILLMHEAACVTIVAPIRLLKLFIRRLMKTVEAKDNQYSMTLRKIQYCIVRYDIMSRSDE